MKRYKFPRTYHLPSSLSVSSDDKTLKDYSNFVGKSVVITEKLDGESFTVYSDGYCHARSIDSKNHEARNAAKRIAAFKYQLIPDGYRISCENVFAKHSIKYTNLKGYLYLFGAWDSNNYYLPFKDLVDLNKSLELPMPKVLYLGQFDEQTIKGIINQIDPERQEGFVIRNTDGFHYDHYSINTGKFVRQNHVQTNEHWMHQKLEPNLIDYEKIT